MKKRKHKPAGAARLTSAEAKARSKERRMRKAAAHFLAPLAKRRLLYVAALRDFARAAAETGPGYDGAPPVIVDAPEPGENPQIRVARNLREHPLELMAHRRQIAADQYGAGDLYRRDLELAEISPMSARHLESIYTTELSSAKALKEAGLDEMLGPKTFAARAPRQALRWRDLEPYKLDAIDRANRARRAIEAAAGRDAAQIATHVCRDRLTLTELGTTKKYGNRNRVGRLMQAALDALAEHYGMRGRGRRGAIRSWGDGMHIPRADAERASEAPVKCELEAVE